MTADVLIRLDVCAYIVIAACLFLAVDGIEPNRRLAVVLECAIAIAGGAAILDQLF